MKGNRNDSIQWIRQLRVEGYIAEKGADALKTQKNAMKVCGGWRRHRHRHRSTEASGVL